MSQDKLYRFIKAELKTLNAKNDLHDGFIHKLSKEQHNLFILQLKRDGKEQVFSDQDQPYRLIGHHLSFYEIEDDKQPFLSQYHYTAYFRDKNNEEYQLHVYINGSDKLVMRPILTKIGHGKVELSEEFSANLKEMAIKHSAPIMAQLRQQFNNKIKTLADEYKNLEAQLSALSVALSANKKKYLALLDVVCTQLETLIYFKEDEQYEALLRLFTVIKAKLTMPSAVQSEAKEAPSQTSVQASSIPEALEGLDPKRPAKKPFADLVVAVSASHDEYLKLMKDDATLEIQLTGFLELHKITHEALLSIDDIEFENSLAHLHTLNQFLEKCNALGVKLLEAMLVNKRYDLANTLRQYTPALAERMAKFAFRTGNGALLDFLLTHHVFSINTFVMDGLNPIQYCLKFHTEKTPKNAVFSVLIKHKAALQLEDEEGLPVVFQFLTEAKFTEGVDSFSTLLSNSYDTGERKALYKDAIRRIDAYLATHELDAAKKTKIEIFLARLELSIPMLTPIASVLEKRLVTSTHNYVVNLPRFLKDLLFGSRLLADADLKNKIIEYAESRYQYMKQLPPLLRLQLLTQESETAKTTLDVAGGLEKLAAHFDVNIVLSIEVINKIKQSAISILDEKIKFFKAASNPAEGILRKATNKQKSDVNKLVHSVELNQVTKMQSLVGKFFTAVGATRKDALAEQANLQAKQSVCSSTASFFQHRVVEIMAGIQPFSLPKEAGVEMRERALSLNNLML
jgi:hypothetical protein